MKNLRKATISVPIQLESAGTVKEVGGTVKARVHESKGIVLTTIRVFATIRHADEAFGVDFAPINVFVFEVAAVDGGAAGAICFGCVATLDHEVLGGIES